MAPTVFHTELNTTFQGVDDDRFDSPVQHFRGIQYGKIQSRFALPEANHDYSKTTNATEFGPVCPQPKVDVGHLLRLPDKQPELVQDEFQCLNLNVTRPVLPENGNLIPVMVWIHGGSQVVTFASPALPVCDPTRMVAQSANDQNPIIVVTFNYRLNIFAFGDGKGARNLALKDQSLLIHWVKQNIVRFGGDPENITLAGESAGAVYAHAQVVMGAPVHRLILASGSLHLSTPLPTTIGDGLIKRLENAIGTSGSLATSPPEVLIQALAQCKVNSMWIQADESLAGWQEKKIEMPLLVGDVEFESILWRLGIEEMSAAQIEECFNAAGTHASDLKQLYRVDAARLSQTRFAALDFLCDARYGLPIDLMCLESSSAPHKRYRYVFDETNPWQSSSRAHHAVDLIYLFGGYQFEKDGAAEHIGMKFRQSWTEFVCGKEPWNDGKTFAFGPHGQTKSLERKELSRYRRTHCYEKLRSIGFDGYNPAFAALAQGRISLLN